ncbi:MAG: HAMP domain-containing histidine kinase [Clostridiales bacterium]|nr:HAMP domain-containing histidine kinase [Clostridiales bacterium]
MNREAIKKPNFMRLFAVRFIISCMVFLIIASALLYLLDNAIDEQMIYGSYLTKIGDKTRALYGAEPGSEEYEKLLAELKISISIYQTVGHNYAEVHMGSEVITVPDTVYIFVNDEKQNLFFLEDTAYLDPVNKYENGRFNIKDYTAWIDKNQFELIYMIANELIRRNDNGLYDRFYTIKDAYINRDTHTFIPGKISVVDFGKEYIIDCTPKDTKGYEKYEPSWTSDGLMICYKMDDTLTGKDANNFILPSANNEIAYENELSFYEQGFDKTKPWYVAYRADYIDHHVFETAPLTSKCIIISAVVLAGLVSFILANIRYHKDNTIWKIFEYRTKIAEAMAHDLKTPLAAIGAYAESMEAFPGDASKTAEYTAKITEKVGVMDHMIEDILSLSKGARGKMSIASEEVSVMSVVNESIKSFPDMKTDLKGNDIKLKTDRKLLAQAIDNLMSNCDRYKEKESPVEIILEPSQLTITNKTSSSYDDVESLKQPFVKGSDSRSDKGTGLGLSIADNNLNILGYKLELSSRDGVFEARIKFK